MKIRNISPRGALDVPLLGRTVEAGAVVEVTAAQASRLLPQADNWAKVQPTSTPRAAASGPTRKGEAK